MPDTPAAKTVYRFGLFEADARTGELRKQGRPLRLRGRPFDILLLLLERAGDVIGRDELRQQLWPADTFVDFDHGLNSAMNRLREALGDSAENPRFIETLPRRGYRFVAPIHVVQTAPAVTAPAVAVIPGAAPPVFLPQPTPVSAAGPEVATRLPVAPWIVVSRPSRIVLLLASGAL
ncbi:MAG: transcriptional regulator, partial [Acidobacteria bacterium]|nr:transcriptional regulator [Acidobacteriota bacterium]